MPLWPFRKRRRDSVIKEKEPAFEPLLESGDEKAELSRPPSPPPRKRGLVSSPASGTASPIPIPRRSSKRPSPLPLDDDIEQLPEALMGKENVPPGPAPAIMNKVSKESMTALPKSYKLQYSPHLRPVDMERPHIPYNFRTQSGSQVHVPSDGTPDSAKPNVLRKKRSSYDAAYPQRHRSTRSRKDEQVREEEIRAMSAHSAIPKRPGEGPLRRDSKKMRSGMKESAISLPAHAESAHEGLGAIVEQSGWEIGAMNLFNPRPAVRLSGVPQYVSPISPRPTSPNSPVPPSRSEKRPISRRKELIGDKADALDSNDIRMLLERDAKRREERKREQQEKLDRKLRKREGRNRADSDRRKREAEERRKAEQLERDAEFRSLPPAAIHPALRDSPESPREAVGLGIAAVGAGALLAAEGVRDIPAQETHDISPLDEPTENPFADPADEAARPSIEHTTRSYAASESAMDEDDGVVVQTAQAVTMSQAATPPLSPVRSQRAPNSLSRIAADNRRASDVPVVAQAPESRRASQPVPDRRQGALASLFRRSAQPRRDELKSLPSEISFSNTSRESMRNQPLPAHLVDTQAHVPSVRRVSATPSRAQSKFREDLPEFPISPPESRTASPDVTSAVAAARKPPNTTQSADGERQGSFATSESEAVMATRSDTPISPSLQPGTSLASVDSEGAWLASGSLKRQSKQTGLGTKRPDFSTSHEELGADTDAQHFNRGSSPGTLRGKARAVEPSETTSDHDFFDAPESPVEMAIVEPGQPTVHSSVRRRPTLIKSDSRIRSREGLVQEFITAGENVVPEHMSDATGRDSFDSDTDPEEQEPQVARATSVRVAHGRNVSTGSAKLLDVIARGDGRAEDSAPGSPLGPRTTRL